MAIDPYATPKSRVADTPHDFPDGVFVPIGLGWLVHGPVLLASIYTGYRDNYYEN